MDSGGKTLTYLFTDLEGSTRLWERHPDAMHAALATHDQILRGTMESSGGTVVKMTGDGLMAVFDDPADAVKATVQAQRRLAAEEWGEPGSLRVRMGMHVGDSQARAGDYYGPDVNRAARVMAAAHGGQVLLSAPTVAAVQATLSAEVTVRDLGTHRLKDLAGPEQLYQLVAPGLEDTFPPLSTLDLRPNNLPTQTSVFFGREQLLADLRELIDDDTRLLTLTGPGGTGKTRLALQAAAEQIDRFDDGVFFVDLSSDRQPDAAFATIMRTVAITGGGEDPPLEVLKRGLRDTTMLLVLDNLEQVTGAAPGLADLLAHCPGLRVLATSREALRVRGERICQVPPLEIPNVVAGDVSVDQAMGSEAVRLFVDRATAAWPEFELRTEDVGAVTAICVLLDGLPLAIELAAARVGLFGIDELQRRLDRRFDVLRGGARDLPERQQTLRAAIEWSNELLDDDERLLLRLFSVFAGAQLPDVEEAVARLDGGPRLDVIELVASLVDKSLIQRGVHIDGRPRFSMLQTIRDYATEKLDEDPDLAFAARRAHAEHYTDLAVRFRRRLAEIDRDEVLAALSGELANLRAAWVHWTDTGEVTRLNELLEPLWGYYDARGEYAAAVDLGNDLLEVLRLQPETVERVRDEIAVEMSLARSLIAVRGYTAEVEASIRAAVDRGVTGMDAAPQRFPVLRSLATLHMMRSDYLGGAAVGRELLEIAQQQGDSLLLSDAHLVVGVNTAFVEGLSSGIPHLDTSIEHYDAARSSLVQFRVGPSPGVVANVVSGLMLWFLGFPDRAKLRVHRALDVAAELGHPYSQAYALFHASVLYLFEQDMEQVAAFGDAATTVANANDYPIWRALGLVMRGTSRIASGDHEGGLAEVDGGFELYDGLTTPPIFWPLLLTVRALGCAMAARLDAANAFLDEAIGALPEDDFQLADMQVMRGDFILASPEPDLDAAAACFDKAIEIGTAGGMRMATLAAVTRKAMLATDDADRQMALADLRRRYDEFTEGFDSPALVAARQLLEA